MLTQPNAVFRAVKGHPVPGHCRCVDGNDHRASVASAHRHCRLKIAGEVDKLPAHFSNALPLNGGVKPGGRSMVEVFRRPGLLQLHIHLNGVALVGPDFGVVPVEGVPLLVVLPDNALQGVHIDVPPCAAYPGQQGFHIRPAVFVQRNSRRAGVVAQDQTQKSAQLYIRIALLHFLLLTFQHYLPALPL